MLLMVAPLFLIAYIYLLQQLLYAEGLTSWSTGVSLVIVSFLGVLLITLIYRTWPSVGLSLATLGVGLMLVGFTAFVGFRATYNNGEEPIEMLVYAGASADVRQLATDLRKAADHNRVRAAGQALESQKKPLCILLPSLWFLRKIVLRSPRD